MGIFSIIYLAVLGTAIAFVLYFWLLKTTSAVLMSLITFITPPLALLWGWLILGEVITLHLVLGMLVIFSGIAIVRRSR
jgi:drug/metabolite transporter (DMT)-like permease